MLTKNKAKNYIASILITTLLFLFQTSTVFGQGDFVMTSSMDIYLENISDNFTSVTETLEIAAKNESYFIPKGSQQTVTIKKDQLVKDTLKVTGRGGREKIYSIEEVGENLKIVIETQRDINTRSPFFIEVKYKTNELVNHNGNITNLYIPGLHQDAQFEEINPNHNLKTIYQYNASYNIPIDAPQTSFSSPDSITQEEDKNYRTYTFPQEGRINNMGWIQLGTEQFYSFRMVQKTPKTDFLTPKEISKYTNWVSKNILEIALPREFNENNQEVFFTNITPEPKKIKTDDEGNVFGIFEVDANREGQIIIEGYIKLSESKNEIPDFTLKNYKTRLSELNRLDMYTSSDIYWESNSQEIQNVADQLVNKSGDASIIDLIKKNYDFVIENLDYNHAKAEGDNTRYGALAALQGAESVCMEYADLMIAILRAQGIPARAAFGYGNDPLLEETEREIGHQWVQVWIPDYGWLSVDPTWGETGREYIGGDLDHILWYTSGHSEQNVRDLLIVSADNLDINNFERYSINIEPLKEDGVSDLTKLDNISDIALLYTSSETEELLKTTMAGRALVFIIPIGAILIVITIITTLVSKILKRN